MYIIAQFLLCEKSKKKIKYIFKIFIWVASVRLLASLPLGLIYMMLLPMLLSLSMLLLVPMLLQVFCYCWPCCCWLYFAAWCPCIMMLQHDVLLSLILTSSMLKKPYCPWRETLFISPCRKSLPVPGVRPFLVPNAGKTFRVLEGDIFLSSMPEKPSGPWRKTFSVSPCRKKFISSMGVCKGSASRDWKGFSGVGKSKKRCGLRRICSCIDNRLSHPLLCNYPTGSLNKKSFVTMHFDFKKYN